MSHGTDERRGDDSSSRLDRMIQLHAEKERTATPLVCFPQQSTEPSVHELMPVTTDVADGCETGEEQFVLCLQPATEPNIVETMDDTDGDADGYETGEDDLARATRLAHEAQSASSSPSSAEESDTDTEDKDKKKKGVVTLKSATRSIRLFFAGCVAFVMLFGVFRFALLPSAWSTSQSPVGALLAGIGLFLADLVAIPCTLISMVQLAWRLNENRFGPVKRLSLVGLCVLISV
jgi:hypothetical protein